MDIDTLTTMNAELYRIVMMLMEGFTLIVGLASAMFVLVAIVCAACDFFGEMGQSARRQIKPAPEARPYEAMRALAGLE